MYARSGFPQSQCPWLDIRNGGKPKKDGRTHYKPDRLSTSNTFPCAHCQRTVRIYARQEKIYFMKATDRVFAVWALCAGERSGSQLPLADRYERIDARCPLRGYPAGQQRNQCQHTTDQHDRNRDSVVAAMDNFRQQPRASEGAKRSENH